MNRFLVKAKYCFGQDVINKSKNLIKKISKHQQKLGIHQKVSKIKSSTINQFANNLSEHQLAQKLVAQSKYDKQLAKYISKFNEGHKDSINLLDFSNYATQFGDLKNASIKESDIQILREFQKRQIDNKVNKLRQLKTKLNLGENNATMHLKKGQQLFTGQIKLNKPQTPNQQDEIDDAKPFAGVQDILYRNSSNQGLRQGIFQIQDSFVMLLLNLGITTKITTLNRINSFRVLVFMGNGHGLISYGKARGQTVEATLNKAIQRCKQNIIAIPLDPRCSLPLPINKRWQDYRLYLRPNVGFNGQGHPIMSIMLSLSGIDHAGFKTVHTGKNVYNIVNVLFKALTTNTTPQELAEQQGFKIYRHQFIRPLTECLTHRPLSD